MGLDVHAKGMPPYSISYIRYGTFRAELVRKVYGDECYNIFMIPPFIWNETPHEEIQTYIGYWNSVCNEDLDLFLLHSDCDGKFTPQECKRILKALKPIELDLPDRDMSNMLDNWKAMFRHCAKRRVNMYFG